MSNEFLKISTILALCKAEKQGTLPVFDCTEENLPALVQVFREIFPEFQKRDFIPVIRLTDKPGYEQDTKEFVVISLLSMTLFADQLSNRTGETGDELLQRFGAMAVELYNRFSAEELSQFLSKRLSFLQKL